MFRITSVQLNVLKKGCQFGGAIKQWPLPSLQIGTTVPARPAELAQACNPDIMSCWSLSDLYPNDESSGIMMRLIPCSLRCAILNCPIKYKRAMSPDDKK